LGSEPAQLTLYIAESQLRSHSLLDTEIRSTAVGHLALFPSPLMFLRYRFECSIDLATVVGAQYFYLNPDGATAMSLTGQNEVADGSKRESASRGLSYRQLRTYSALALSRYVPQTCTQPDMSGCSKRRHRTRASTTR
jgi:hypothetical protein